MSLYREPGRERRRRRLIGLGIVAGAVVLAALTALLAGGADPSSPADRAKTAREAAAAVLDGLELVEIEYGQAVQGGRVVAETEYEATKAHVARARKAISSKKEDVDSVDGGAAADIDAALAAIAVAVDGRVGPEMLRAEIARATERVSALLDAAASR